MTGTSSQIGPDLAFHSFLRKGEFRLQVCAACSLHIFFPRTICPHCGDDDLQWKKVSGRATVYSTTIIRQRPERGGDYNLCLVDLAEGPRMMSRIVGVPPDEVRIGMHVAACIEQIDELPAVVFRAVDGVGA